MFKVIFLIGLKYNAGEIEGKSGRTVDYIFPKLHDTKMGILLHKKHDIDHVGLAECSSSIPGCKYKYDLCQI